MDPSSGIAAHVTDAGTLDVALAWDAAECRETGPGRIRCRKADNPSTQLKLRALPSTPGLHRFTLVLSHLAIQGPFTPPLALTLTNAGTIDRVGTMGACRGSRAGMTCRQ